MKSNYTRLALSGVRQFVSVLTLASLIASPALAEEVVFEPIKDATIYQHDQGMLANGMGSYLLVGINGSNGGNRIMRTLIAFDVSSIPAGSTINSARLVMSQSLPRDDQVARPATLHRLLKDWSEGPSDAQDGEAGGDNSLSGDSTWLHTNFSDTLWDNPGGDFDATVSSSVDVRGNQSYIWPSTGELVEDVQRWVDDPSENFGWLIKGQESLGGANFTARRFSSRHATAVNNRPNLIIDFTPNARPDLVFTQYVTGAGNYSRVILRNNADMEAAGHLAFVDESGDPSQVSIDGILTDEVDFSIQPWGSFDLMTDATGELSEGAIQVFVESGSPADLEGTEIFFLLNRYVSVPGADPEKEWQVYVSRDETENTGIAVQNPDRTSTATLELTLLDSTGTEAAVDTLILQPGQRISDFLGQDLLFRDYFEQNPGNFAGTLNVRVLDGEDVALLGLIQKSTGDLIAIEATNNPFINEQQP